MGLGVSSSGCTADYARHLGGIVGMTCKAGDKEDAARLFAGHIYQVLKASLDPILPDHEIFMLDHFLSLLSLSLVSHFMRLLEEPIRFVS